ncbi:cytochrome P450 [Thamnocephalis sphaerospora]|uniref:Cytochrome P450 n=1 Tax=Thamnocephalis sphaerospora TaxID=78915 RepID=A0A4P9XL69_9FUNG|nr:cytochrome P450 [Thamnocephalis sphaerospora]|eukprot:RKP06594.1 cytochrome P450 [Thamnocephalis sphaerospora]
MWSLLELSVAVAETLLMLVCAYAAYRMVGLLVAPLASVPGPWHTRITGAVHFAALLRGTSWAYVAELHRIYGPIVRLGPNTISITDANAVRLVMSSHRFRKSDIYRVAQFGGESNIVTERDPVLHKSRKKIIAPAFSSVAMASLEPIILDVGINKLVAAIEAQSAGGASVDLRKLLVGMTLDVMGAVAFGSSFDMLGAATHPITSWVYEALIFAFGRFVFGNKLAALLLPKHKRGETALVQYATRMIERRRRLEHPPQDVLQSLISAIDKNTGQGLPSAHVGGSATTSTTLVWAMILLFERPECMARLVAEIVEASPQIDEPITHAKVYRLPYLNAVLREVLRMRSPTSTGLPRVTPRGGTVLCNLLIPGGTDIIVSPYAVNNDIRNYEMPSLFNPDRWLVASKSGSETSRIDMSFSTGVRACLGQNLAWLELRVALATLLRKFKFELLPGQDLRPKLLVLLQPADAKLVVTVSRRDS